MQNFRNNIFTELFLITAAGYAVTYPLLALSQSAFVV